MKKYAILVLMAIMMLTLIGCKKKDSNEINETTDTPTGTPTPSVTQPIATKAPEVENHEGEVKSKLTGLWVPEEIGNKRPYAIMLNNIKLASPQSGTADADILYEAIVEGAMTRLMGIYEKLDPNRIGSVRSARHYFVSFADEYDAIFVHYGETKYATSKISKLGIDNLSGLTGIGETVFYRDKSIKAPHNAFASKDGILKGTETKGYETEYDKDYEGHFSFYEEDLELASEKEAKKVTLNFSNYTSPYFTYNQEDKLYYRFQFGQEHIDANTGIQLSFKNLIVQFVDEWDIDKNDYQTMDIENATGKGYYITNGKAVDITWAKDESSRKMRYYDIAGNELKINPGKTYIAIFPDDRMDKVTFTE